jgi:tetratricopeptide (TPR) repeat protein/predicted Ser/Thr protein kinase
VSLLNMDHARRSRSSRPSAPARIVAGEDPAAETQTLHSNQEPVAQVKSAATLPPNIGPYRILRLLGEGGMGVVYEAEQSQPRRLVALKMIKAAWASPETLRRFEAESQALARLQHPGIAQIYEAGSTDTGFGAQPYFAMELIHGKPLVEYVNQKKLSTRQRLELMIQVCDAVHHAHQRGIIHRDLKPGNILVDEAGQPKILDFGLARATDSDAKVTRQTDVGQLLGTLAYMSPEQVLADPLAVDMRSDVYALGVMLYELLAGKLPYLLPNLLHEAVRTIRQTDAAPLSTIDRTYRGDIETIVAKALEKDKARRYVSAAELAADIRRHLNDEPIVARPASAVYQLQKFAHRHKALVAGVAAVFAILVAGTVVSTWQAVKARRAQKEAEKQSAIAQAVSDFLQKDLLAQASSFNQSRPDPDMKVRSALDRAAQNIEGKFKHQPEVEAAIRSTIGEAYSDLGLYADSRKQLEKALELSRGSLGPDNLKTLQIMVSLGWLAQEQGHIEEAEKLQKQALDAGRQALGATNPTTLMALRRLGGVYLQESKYPQAEATLSEALQSLKRVNGSDNRDILAATNNLGAVYKQEGKFAQAEAMYRQSWNISKKLFGADSPQTLPSMGNLGILLNHVGKKSEAEDIDRQTLDIARRGLGPEHPYTLMAMDILAITCAEQGKYAEAESLNNQEFEIKRRVLGPDHPETLRALGNLGEDYALAGNYPRAEEFLSQAVEAEKRTVGFRSDLTLDHMNTLAEAYAKDRQPAKAEQLDFQVFTNRRELLGAGNPDTLQSLNALVRDYKAEGKLAQADELLQQAHAPQPEKPAQAAQ